MIYSFALYFHYFQYLITLRIYLEVKVIQQLSIKDVLTVVSKTVSGYQLSISILNSKAKAKFGFCTNSKHTYCFVLFLFDFWQFSGRFICYLLWLGVGRLFVTRTFTEKLCWRREFYRLSTINVLYKKIIKKWLPFRIQTCNKSHLAIRCHQTINEPSISRA